MLSVTIDPFGHDTVERVLKELTPECEVTARMYAQGYEKKEIASMKFRALSTVSNQLQTAFSILHVRNGRELARIVYERITGMKLTMDFSPAVRSVVACFLLGVFSLSLYQGQSNMTRTRKGRTVRIEYRLRDYEGKY
jgi:DNA-binding CsgD family transcriptional regulator